MDRFISLKMDLIGCRYRENQRWLVEDLMEIGLIQKVPPVCHGSSMEIKDSNPWQWRCMDWRCATRKSVITEESWFSGKRKIYEVFKLLYMWSNGFSPLQIVQEVDLSRKVVSSLWQDLRKLLKEENAKAEPLGRRHSDIIECDETCIGGTRKYHRGAKKRESGEIWVQTIVESKESKDGEETRRAKKLRASVVPDRSQATLIGNIREAVEPGSYIQTDGWRGYAGLKEAGFSHDTVVHKETFVARAASGKKVCTNTVEGVHSALKRKARQMNLFAGNKISEELIRNKVEELVWRFNTREDKDKLPLLLYILSSNYPCDTITDVQRRLDVMLI